MIADTSNKGINRINTTRDATAPNTANSETTRYRHRRPLYGWAKAAGSRSPSRTGLRAAHRSRTAPAAKSGSSETGGVLGGWTAQERRVHLAGEDSRRSGSGCARHVHRPQGATVALGRGDGRSQTSKETAYIEAHGRATAPNWFITREDGSAPTDRPPTGASSARRPDASKQRPNTIPRASRAARPTLGTAVRPRPHSTTKSDALAYASRAEP